MRDIGRLHLVTGADEDLLDIVDAALAGGVDTVQVRVDRCTGDRQAYQLTTLVLARCRASGATCLVDDRVDVAAASGAHGCHLGAEDLPVALARAVLGPRAVIGATARTPESARQAVRDGASYLGVGPVHATSTKTGLAVPLARPVSGGGRGRSAPVVAIGGLPGLAEAARAAGAHGVAVASAITAAPDPAAAALARRRSRSCRGATPGRRSGITVNGVPPGRPARHRGGPAPGGAGVPAGGIAVAVNGRRPTDPVGRPPGGRRDEIEVSPPCRAVEVMPALARLPLVTDRFRCPDRCWTSSPRAWLLDPMVLVRERTRPIRAALAGGWRCWSPRSAAGSRWPGPSTGGNDHSAAGVHGRHLAARERGPVLAGTTLRGSRSRHGTEEVRRAARQGADYVTLSPIYPTRSKPGYGPALGTTVLTEATPVPVYALGGIATPARVHHCLRAGAAGVAVMGVVMRATRPGRVVSRLLAGIDLRACRSR